MNQIKQTEAIPRRGTVPGLLLHCGAEIVDRKTVLETPTPKNTDTWYPLAHQNLIEEVAGHLEAASFTVTGEVHALSHEGDRYFGFFEVNSHSESEDKDYSWIVGLRNSHDKRMAKRTG